MQDTGKAVVTSPTQGDAPAKKVAGSAKEVSGDPLTKGRRETRKMSKPKPAGQNKGMQKDTQTKKFVRYVTQKTTIVQQL